MDPNFPLVCANLPIFSNRVGSFPPHLYPRAQASRVRNRVSPYIYSASRLQGPLFQFFTSAFVFFCRMGTVGDVKLKVYIRVDKLFLIVCV